MTKRFQRPCVQAFLAAGLLSATAGGAEWPQYRGPNQDGVSLEDVAVEWGEAGPRTVWRRPVQSGFSSLAVSGGRAFTQVVRDGDPPKEVCLALDAASGKELWTAEVGVGKGYSGGGKGDGPRSTPAVNDGMVYVLTPMLAVHALDARTGEPVWSRDLIQQHDGRNIGWRNAASPVLDGNLLFVGGGGAGQSLLALDKKNGKVVWKGFDETITHSTPLVATIHGQRQVVFYLKSGLLSVAVDTGRELWRYPFPFKTSSAITPVQWEDIVYCSAGYGVGGGAVRIVKTVDGFRAEELWRVPGNDLVANHWSTPVAHEGYLYGMFCFKQFKSGPLKCVDLRTGEIAWSQQGYGQGNLIRVGNRLLALADTGRLDVVEATADGYRRICSTPAVEGKSWSTPAFSNGRIYVRSAEQAACLAP